MLRRYILAAAIAAALAPWPVRGNSKSQIYFWPGCSNYSEIAARRAMEFPSACAAEAAGFRPAKNCHRAIPVGHRGKCDNGGKQNDAP
ncbi:MAG: hypothetical protein ACLPQ0_05215 [Candidatus Binatus sp.]|jgi:hypothetical protein